MYLSTEQKLELTAFINECLLASEQSTHPTEDLTSSEATSLQDSENSTLIKNAAELHSSVSFHTPTKRPSLLANFVGFISPLKKSPDTQAIEITSFKELKDFLTILINAKLFTPDEFRRIPSLNEHALNFFGSSTGDSSTGNKIFLITKKIITFNQITQISTQQHSLLDPIHLASMVDENAEKEEARLIEVARVAEVSRLAEEAQLAEVTQLAEEFSQQKMLAESICKNRLTDGFNRQIERIAKDGANKTLITSLKNTVANITAHSPKKDNNNTIELLLKSLNIGRKGPVTQTKSHAAITKLQTMIDHDYLTMTTVPMPGFAQAVELSNIIRNGMSAETPAETLKTQITTFLNTHENFNVGYVKLINGSTVLSSMALRTMLNEVVTDPKQRQAITQDLIANGQTVIPSAITWETIQQCLTHYDAYTTANEKVSKKSAALITEITTTASIDPSATLTNNEKTKLITDMHQQHHFKFWIDDQHPAQKTCSHIINRLYGLESSEDCHELYIGLMSLSKQDLKKKLAIDFSQGSANSTPPSSSRDNASASCGGFFSDLSRNWNKFCNLERKCRGGQG